MAAIHKNQVIDVTGQRYGRLVAVKFEGVRDRAAWFLCKCDCGATVVVRSHGLRNGTTKSCGCFNRDAARARMTKHGLVKEAEYKIWCAVKSRVLNPKDKSFPRYGGRGVSICDEWRDDFARFYADMGPRPSPAHSIERIDNSLGYNCGKCDDCLKRGVKANCRWATPLEQGQNTRRNRRLSYRGQTLILSEWSRRTGLGHKTITARLKSGLSVEEALSKKPGYRGEDNGSAKLNARTVIVIRSRIAAGEKLKSIAEDYGVSDGAIRAIRNRRNWRWLP